MTHSAVDGQFLARLLDEHSAALVLFARQWCTAPEDVVQEAFVKLARQPRRPPEPAAWLYRVVRNGAISQARSQRRRRRRETAVARRDAWFNKDADGLDAQRARQALASLPPEERALVVARIWGGLTFAQLAALTGTTTSTAHRQYERALAHLRQQLDESCPQRTDRSTRS